MEMILALDVSTSITGFTILDRGGHFQTMSYIDLRKEKSLFKKIEIVQERLKYIKELYNISKVFIEDRMQAFAMGKSSAWVINLLTAFNGMVSLVAYQTFALEPQYINVVTARKQVIGKARIKGKDTKEMVLEWVKKEYPQLKWDLKKTGKDKDYNGDMADSMIIARAGLLLLDGCQH